MADLPRHSARLASRIRFVVSTIIQKDLRDPRLGMVTVLRVEPSHDLREAKIYYSIFGDESVKSRCRHAVESASGYIQRELGKNLGTRHTPHLSFILDQTQDKQTRIESLLQDLSKGEHESAMAKKPSKKPGAVGKDAEKDVRSKSRKRDDADDLSVKKGKRTLEKAAGRKKSPPPDDEEEDTDIEEEDEDEEDEDEIEGDDDFEDDFEDDFDDEEDDFDDEEEEEEEEEEEDEFEEEEEEEDADDDGYGGSGRRFTRYDD